MESSSADGARARISRNKRRSVRGHSSRDALAPGLCIGRKPSPGAERTLSWLDSAPGSLDQLDCGGGPRGGEELLSKAAPGDFGQPTPFARPLEFLPHSRPPP